MPHAWLLRVIVDGIKMYAATHAAREENHRNVNELAEVLQSGEQRERVRKEFVDATRAKVLSAAQRHVGERKKKDDATSTAKVATARSPASKSSVGSTSNSGAAGGGAVDGSAPSACGSADRALEGRWTPSAPSEVAEAIEELTRRRRALMQAGCAPSRPGSRARRGRHKLRTPAIRAP